MTATGWVWTDGHIVGDLDHWTTEYHWNGATFTNQLAAIRAGLKDYGSDDFNLAHIINDEVVWWGWMHEPHELGDAANFARFYGFVIAGSSVGGETPK